MQKRVIIIHGWNGYPEEGWFPWLTKQLEQQSFQVQVPAMPDPAKPEIKAWVSHLSNTVGTVDENTFFIGHSIGCQAILRYLETLPTKTKIGGAVFVAGWFTLMNLKMEEEEIAKPWLEIPVTVEKVEEHDHKFFAIFSDNDESVPQDNKEMFEQILGAKTLLEHNKGHFSGSDGVTELPSALAAVLEMAGA
jgi:predicted alpha/beta hydrolase family esterase